MKNSHYLKQFCSNLFFICMLIFFSLEVKAQHTLAWDGACVEFQSPGNDPSLLHFYIFGDGYYKKAYNPEHKFRLDFDYDKDTQYFSAEPYEPEEPEEEGIIVIDPGTSTGPCDFGEVEVDGNVELDISWNFTHHGKTFILLKFKDQITENGGIADGSLQLNFNPNKVSIDVDNIQYYNEWAELDPNQTTNSRLRWTFDQLNEGRVLYIPATVHPDNHKSVVLTARIFENDDWTGLVDLHRLVSRVESTPHDPNYIKPIEPYYISETNVLNNTSNATEQYVVYEVQFHNDGDGPVEDVEVLYEFSYASYFSIVPAVEAEYKTIELLQVSKPYVGYNVDNTFYFDDIYLPGLASGADYDDTIIKFQFVVCHKNKIEILDCIDNTIDIAFITNDIAQAPVSANEVICVDHLQKSQRNPCYLAPSNKDPSSRGDNSQNNLIDNNIKIDPNPCNDYINLELPQDVAVRSIKVLSINGMVMFEQNQISNQINTQQLIPGMYFLRVELENEIQTIRFIKQ